MKEDWKNENFCTFDEKVRVELTPQMVELPCTHANLDNSVTAAHYQAGRIDALGRVLMPENSADPEKAMEKRVKGAIKEGEMMTCVDWRQKHKPKIWKIYQQRPILDDAGEAKLNVDGEPRHTYVEVGEELDKDTALAIASKLAGEM